MIDPTIYLTPIVIKPFLPLLESAAGAKLDLISSGRLPRRSWHRIGNANGS